MNTRTLTLFAALALTACETPDYQHADAMPFDDAGVPDMAPDVPELDAGPDCEGECCGAPAGEPCGTDAELTACATDYSTTTATQRYTCDGADRCVPQAVTLNTLWCPVGSLCLGTGCTSVGTCAAGTAPAVEPWRTGCAATVASTLSGPNGQWPALETLSAAGGALADALAEGSVRWLACPDGAELLELHGQGVRVQLRLPSHQATSAPLTVVVDTPNGPVQLAGEVTQMGQVPDAGGMLMGGHAVAYATPAHARTVAPALGVTFTGWRSELNRAETANAGGTTCDSARIEFHFFGAQQ